MTNPHHTTNPTIIGLTGLAGSGKDTVRQLLEGMGLTGFAFADPIRQMLREFLTANGFDSSYMDERTLKEQPIPGLGVSYRHLAQTLGTEWGRAVSPTLWLDTATRFMEDTDLGDSVFVISDVRFINEANWIRSRGGIVWRVQRPGIEPVRPHASEQEQAQIEADWVIQNSGTIEDLTDRVLAAWQVL